MASYSTNPNISTVAEQVQEVKLQMQKNVQAVMNRGEDLENLERRTERLEETGGVFKKSSTQVKSAFAWKNRKWTFFLILFIILLLVLISLAIYLNVKN